MDTVMIAGAVGGLIGLIVFLGLIAAVFQIAASTKATLVELERQGTVRSTQLSELVAASKTQTDLLFKIAAK